MSASKNSLHVRAAGAYRLLVRLYPQQFRTAYGEAMLQNFNDLYRDAQHIGPLKTFSLFLSTIKDVVCSLPREHLESWKKDQLTINVERNKPRTILFFYGVLLFHLVLFLSVVDPWLARYDDYPPDMRMGIPPCHAGINRFFESGWGSYYPLIIIAAWLGVFLIKRGRLVFASQLDSWTATKDALLVFPSSLVFVWIIGQIAYSLC